MPVLYSLISLQHGIHRQKNYPDKKWSDFQKIQFAHKMVFFHFHRQHRRHLCNRLLRGSQDSVLKILSQTHSRRFLYISCGGIPQRKRKHNMSQIHQNCQWTAFPVLHWQHNFSVIHILSMTRQIIQFYFRHWRSVFLSALSSIFAYCPYIHSQSSLHQLWHSVLLSGILCL